MEPTLAQLRETLSELAAIEARATGESIGAVLRRLTQQGSRLIKAAREREHPGSSFHRGLVERSPEEARS